MNQEGKKPQGSGYKGYKGGFKNKFKKFVKFYHGFDTLTKKFVRYKSISDNGDILSPDDRLIGNTGDGTFLTNDKLLAIIATNHDGPSIEAKTSQEEQLQMLNNKNYREESSRYEIVLDENPNGTCSGKLVFKAFKTKFMGFTVNHEATVLMTINGDNFGGVANGLQKHKQAIIMKTMNGPA